MGISRWKRQFERENERVEMPDWSHVEGGHAEDFVAFSTAGEPAKGEYHCSECGYGVMVFRRLPVCPMCAGKTWEQTSWSPFAMAS